VIAIIQARLCSPLSLYGTAHPQRAANGKASQRPMLDALLTGRAPRGSTGIFSRCEIEQTEVR
jgi:hypothetical protein